MHADRLEPIATRAPAATASRPADRHLARRPRRGTPPWAWLVARGLGAVAVLVAGVVHLHQYGGPYQAISPIGTLFLVHFGAATAIGVALLAPIEHVAGRWAGPLVALVTAAGIALSTGSVVMLAVSERSELFGFHEPGYDPPAIGLARGSGIAAAVLLTASLVARFAPASRKARW